MNLSDNYLLVEFPEIGGEALHWWHVVDGKLIRHGQDVEPRVAAGLTDEEAAIAMVALVSPTLASTHWSRQSVDLTREQAAKVAEAEILAASVSKAEGQHVAASVGDDGVAIVAMMAQAELATGLAQLQQTGIDPDIVMPAGLAVAAPDDGFIAADFTFARLLRAPELIAPDEPVFREHLAGENADIAELSQDALDVQLASLAGYNVPNLRSGVFARKRRTAVTERQKKLILTMVAALLLLTVLVPLTLLAKYHFAANAAERDALAVARTVVPDAADLASAQTELDAMLVAQARGPIVFAVPASALFEAVQRAPGVSLRTTSYRPDGTVSATVAAARNEDINVVLLALQQAGYRVTAVPRSDNSGQALADITVRAL